MVRGNWQKRVELADARRQDAKQRKQKSEEKRIFKSMAQELLAMLDRNTDAIQRQRRKRSQDNTNKGSTDNGDSKQQQHDSGWEIHVWTDTLPSTSPPLLELVQEEMQGGGGISSSPSWPRKGKARAVSMDETAMSPKSARKGRGRSGSFQHQEAASPPVGKKKVHPRSHQASAAAAADHNTTSATESQAPLLCKSQFFAGKCLDPQKNGKKGGCRCVHLENTQQAKTLSAVLSSGSNKKGNAQENNGDALEKAEKACAANLSAEMVESGSMEMVYYLKCPLPSNIGESLLPSSNSASSDDQQASNNSQKTHMPACISDLVTEMLNSNGCSVASIVYMVLSTSPLDNRVLLYDRNRNGLVISDFAAEVLGSTATSDGTGERLEDGRDRIQAQDLPVSVLEHILAYVEAPGIASAAQVCTAWHREIRHASPNLWRHLLEQRDWPFPVDFAPAANDSVTPDSANAERQAEDLRDEFIRHYSVYRDMKALQSALSGLLTKKPYEELEMTFHPFSARRNAPQAPNTCVSVEVWGPNQVLAAYSNDCTLRLFQAVARAGSSNEGGSGDLVDKSCRELVCQTIDPYKHTKKKTCFMEAMGLDEDVVGCLLNVSDETNDSKSPHILVILKRDDLLVVDTSIDSGGKISEPEEGSMHVIDVEEAVLNYILSLDQVDHRLLRLNDFLALGGNEDEIEFIVSQSMVACGYGRFMVEVAISIPSPGNDDNDDDMAEDMLLLDRKLFLFSSSVGAIVWMGDSNPANEPLPSRLGDMTLTSLRQALPGSTRRSLCSIAAVSQTFAPFVMSCEIDQSGQIDGNHALGSSEWTQAERLLEETWDSRLDRTRPIVLTPTDVVIGDTLTRALAGNDNGREYKSVITFYSRFPTTDQGKSPFYKLLIGENCMIDRMVGFRDNYIVVLVRFFTETGYAAIDGGGGHWGNEMDRVARVFAITIHVPSRREIERICLYEDFGRNRLSLTVYGDTVACGVWLKGLIMTGSDVRSVQATTTTKSDDFLDDAKQFKKKKKKGRSSKGSGKKDGFARGMSLRG